jgi:hypothetical protein
MNITTPSISIRRQKCSTCCEWFIKVWYIADKDRHVTAVNIKIEKAIKSAPVTPEYLLVRYCWIYHTPTKKKTAGIRWE